MLFLLTLGFAWLTSSGFVRPSVVQTWLCPHVTSHQCAISNWETLSRRRKISHMCALLKAYSGERAWKAIGDRLQRPNYLSRVDHERTIRNRRQRTDIGKYSFVNRIILLWNRLPAEILATLPCKPNAFRQRVRKVINVVNWRKSVLNLRISVSSEV